MSATKSRGPADDPGASAERSDGPADAGLDRTNRVGAGLLVRDARPHQCEVVTGTRAPDRTGVNPSVVGQDSGTGRLHQYAW